MMTYFKYVAATELRYAPKMRRKMARDAGFELAPVAPYEAFGLSSQLSAAAAVGRSVVVAL